MMHLALLLLVVTTQAPADFSGRWTFASSEPARLRGDELMITQTAATLTIEFNSVMIGGTVYPNGQRTEERVTIPHRSTYNLDGSETKNADRFVVFDVDPVSKAAWDGAKLVIVTTAKSSVSTASWVPDTVQGTLSLDTFSRKDVRVPATHVVKQVLSLQADGTLVIETISTYDTGLSSYSPRETRSSTKYMKRVQ
jgi:hypothetical protein